MNEVAEKKGMSTGAKWGLGCGIGCLTIIVILAIAGFIGYKFFMGKIEEVQAELQAKGFENVVQQQQLIVSDPTTEPTLYMGQLVKLVGDCETDVAIMAQMAEVYGTVKGDLYFRGQLLTIQPNAVIEGNLDVLAQGIQNQGEVKGEITGSYQAMP